MHVHTLVVLCVVLQWYHPTLSYYMSEYSYVGNRLDTDRCGLTGCVKPVVRV